MAGDVASAATITYDDDNPSVGEFGSNFSSSMLAAATGGPINTTTIIGHSCAPACSPPSDTNTGGDNFEVTGLIGGQSVALNTTAGDPSVDLYVFDDTMANLLGGGKIIAIGSFPGTSLTVPNDGNMLFDVEIGQNVGTNYSLTLTQTASATPEPSTVSSIGLAVAGALALRRKLRKS